MSITTHCAMCAKQHSKCRCFDARPKPPFPTAADIVAGSGRTWSEAELTTLIDARITAALSDESFEPPEES